MDSNKVLTINNLHVHLADREILSDINFEVNKNDTIAIVGPNGSGKSILFKALLGLIPYSGSIEWAENLKISYLPQKLYIDKELPLSVSEFFSFKSKDERKIFEMLRAVGISHSHQNFDINNDDALRQHIMRQRLGWMSTGQLQRILIAWSLLDDPDVLLFDEPTAGIDLGGEETIYNLLKRLKQEKNFTMFIISHDLNMVYRHANSVLCINKEMICYGRPNEVLDPSALAELYGGEASFYKHEH